MLNNIILLSILSEMGKIGIIGGVIVAIIIGIVIVSFSNPSENVSETVSEFTLQSYTEIGHLLGDPNAPITIVEFGDYQCPFCSEWYLDTMPIIKEQLIDTKKINLVFVDYAFLGPDSLPAARASYCVEEQGKYWEFHDILYSNQKEVNSGWVNLPNIQNFASSIDLDMELFDACMDSDDYLQDVENSIKLASDSGVKQTPTFFIMNSDGIIEKIEGKQPLSTFETILFPYTDVKFVIQEAQEPSSLDAVTPSDASLFIATFDLSQASPVEGSSDAPVTIIEFGDFQCITCGKWNLTIKPDIVTEIFDTGKAKMYFIDFPFQGTDSYTAAAASWCADEQGEYAKYHSNLYVNQGSVDDGWASSEFLKEYAYQLKLDDTQFNECLDSEKFADRVSFNKQVGIDNEVSGTPTFFVIGPDGQIEQINGGQPASVFIDMVNSML